MLDALTEQTRELLDFDPVLPARRADVLEFEASRFKPFIHTESDLSLAQFGALLSGRGLYLENDLRQPAGSARVGCLELLKLPFLIVHSLALIFEKLV